MLASLPACLGKGRGPSASGSQQITRLGMQLPPAGLASLAEAPWRGHGLGLGDPPPGVAGRVGPSCSESHSPMALQIAGQAVGSTTPASFPCK